MHKNKILLSCVVLIACCHSFSSAAVASQINCQRPPQLVDPSQCCQDGGRDQVTENCAKRLGITGQESDTPPTVETATCLAECILTDSGYMSQTDNLDLNTVRNDLTQRFTNDSHFVNTMVAAFRKCEPHAQRKLQVFRQTVPASNIQSTRRLCSPYAGILLGCTYMEYFKNCPAHRWTQNTQCALAKQFVTQCGLGA